ncbi:hypothetical protein [Parasphingorhabdus pacifica]
MSTDPVVLDLLDRKTLRRRAWTVALTGVIIAAALGGVIGLFAGPIGFGVTVVVVAVPLLLLSAGEGKKTSWLHGTKVSVRAFGTRTVDLSTADSLDVLVTDARGMRTVSLLVSGGSKRKTVSLALAIYAGTGGRELGVLALRRLADTLASTGDTRALVLSELVVAQLRSEARGDGAPDRPLYRLASLAPQGRMAQKIKSDAVARFVTALD